MPADKNRRIEEGVLTLGWVSFLTDVSSDMIFPLLPNFLTRTLKAGPAALGLIEGVAEATSSFAKLVSGAWSDRLKRRKPLVLGGYSLAAAVRPLVAFAASWTQVLAIRFSDRLGKGLRTSPRDALLADLVPPEHRGRAFGIQRAMDNAGAVVGPLIAAALLRFVVDDERSVFLLAAIPGVAAVLLILFAVKERPRSAVAERPRAEATAELPRRLKILIGIFVLFTLASSTDAFLILRARDVGIEVWQLPLLWAFFNGVKAAAGLPGGLLADRFGRTPLIFSGWTVYVAAYVGFAFVSRPATLWALFAFYGLFYGLTEGAERALVADMAPASLRGRAFGAFHASVGLAALPASLLFGVFWASFGARVAFLIGAGMALLAAIGLLVFRRSEEAREG